jgi:hypothetical protein
MRWRSFSPSKAQTASALRRTGTLQMCCVICLTQCRTFFPNKESLA